MGTSPRFLTSRLPNFLLLLLLIQQQWQPACGFVQVNIRPLTALQNGQPNNPSHHPLLQQQESNHNNDNDDESLTTLTTSFDAIVNRRTACKKYQRYSENNKSEEPQPTASLSNPSIVQQAHQCLQLAQRAPSSFNTQPYKVVLVHSQDQKKKLSRYALGPNCDRVLDSDCTAVFLADREVLQTFPNYLKWMQETQKRAQPTTFFRKCQLFVYIALFSSGYPLPRPLAAPISWVVRLVFSITSFFSQFFYVLPSFSNAETWTTKQCGLVAMTYMLACASRGLSTSPMEGMNAAGIRRVLKIPRRYSIPMIVATGVAAETKEKKKRRAVARYPSDEMIFCNQFGEASLFGGGATTAASPA